MVFQVCETKSKVLETAMFRRLAHSLLSEKKHLSQFNPVSISRNHILPSQSDSRANIQVRASSRSPLYNSECRTCLISLIRKDKKFLSSYKAPTPVLLPIQPDKQRVPQPFTAGVKLPECKADDSPAYNVEAKNESFTTRLESSI